MTVLRVVIVLFRLQDCDAGPSINFYHFGNNNLVMREPNELRSISRMVGHMKHGHRIQYGEYISALLES